MSEEQLKAFIEKVKSDTVLREKLKASASSEEAIETAKEAGFSIVAEDFQSMQSSATVEVSDEELHDEVRFNARSKTNRANREYDWDAMSEITTDKSDSKKEFRKKKKAFAKKRLIEEIEAKSASIFSISSISQGGGTLLVSKINVFFPRKTQGGISRRS